MCITIPHDIKVALELKFSQILLVNFYKCVGLGLVLIQYILKSFFLGKLEKSHVKKCFWVVQLTI